MTENMKKLLELVSGNKELAAKIGGMGKENIIALAKELGIEFTEADFAQNYTATITGVRGVLDGHTLYWVTRNCCGHKSSIIDTEIHG